MVFKIIIYLIVRFLIEFKGTIKPVFIYSFFLKIIVGFATLLTNPAISIGSGLPTYIVVDLLLLTTISPLNSKGTS